MCNHSRKHNKGLVFQSRYNNLYLPQEFGYSVRKSRLYLRKHTVVALTHFQDYTNTINRVLRNWVHLKYDNMSRKFWGVFFTYMVNYTKNKIRDGIPQGNIIAPNKSVIGRIVERTATSNKEVPRGCSRDELDIFLKIIALQK